MPIPALPQPIIPGVVCDWKIEIQWDGAEWIDATDYVRGEIEVQQAAPHPETGDMTAAYAEFSLDNSDNRFSPYDISSPYSPNVDAGVSVRVSVTFAAVQYWLFYGSIERIEPSESLGPKRVSIYAVDDTWRLGEADARGTDWTGQNVSNIIDDLLDDASWPADRRSIEISPDCAPHFAIETEEKVLDAINRIVAGEGGAWYQDTEGNFVFEDRHYRRTAARSINVQATLDGEYVRLVPQATLRQRMKAARVTVTPVTRGPKQVVWTYPDGGIELDPGETQELFAILDKYTTNVGIENEAVNDSSLSWSAAYVDTGAATGGNSAGPTFYGGKLASLSFTNTSLTRRVRFYDIKILSYPISPLEGFTVDPTDPDGPRLAREVRLSAEYSSGSGFGQTVTLEHPYHESVTMAKGFAQDLVTRVGARRDRPTVELQPGSVGLLATILRTRYSDRVRLIGSTIGLDDEFWVDSVRIQRDANGLTSATWELQAADDAVTVAAFGTAKFGSSQFMGY